MREREREKAMDYVCLFLSLSAWGLEIIRRLRAIENERKRKREKERVERRYCDIIRDIIIYLSSPLVAPRLKKDCESNGESIICRVFFNTFFIV